MAETKKPYDFILQAADDLLANTPALVALVKAEALGHLWEKEEEPDPFSMFTSKPHTPGDTIRNEVATQAIEEMIRAALALAAAREKHARSIETMKEMVAGMIAKAQAKKEGGTLPALGSFHG